MLHAELSTNSKKRNRNFKKNVVFFAVLATTLSALLAAVAYAIDLNSAQGKTVAIGAVFFAAWSSFMFIEYR